MTLRLLLLGCGLGAASSAPTWISSQARDNVESGIPAEHHSARRSGIAILRGEQLSYEIVNGFAVHGGEMVLGPVEQVARDYRSRISRNAAPVGWPDRRDISRVDAEGLRPDGTIPYVMYTELSEEAQREVQRGIDEWNAKTVVELIQRTTEPDFVRFVPRPFHPSDTNRRAHLGRNKQSGSPTAAGCALYFTRSGTPSA